MADAIVIVVILIVCAYAAARGGETERWAAALMCVTTAIYVVICAVLGRAATAYAVDGTLILGFAALYARFRKPWLLSGLCVRLAAAPLHMLILTGEDGAYGVVSRLNLPAYLTLACLLIGVHEHRKLARAPSDVVTP